MPRRARPVAMFPANPPTARTKDSASASDVRGVAGVRSTPTRPMTTASIIDGSRGSRPVLDHGIPEGGPDLPGLGRPVAHPQPERREIRVLDADPDAERPLEERVRLGEHAGAIVA